MTNNDLVSSLSQNNDSVISPSKNNDSVYHKSGCVLLGFLIPTQYCVGFKIQHIRFPKIMTQYVLFSQNNESVCFGSPAGCENLGSQGVDIWHVRAQKFSRLTLGPDFVEMLPPSCCDTGFDRHPPSCCDTWWCVGISANDTFPPQGAGHQSVIVP